MSIVKYIWVSKWDYKTDKEYDGFIYKDACFIDNGRLMEFKRRAEKEYNGYDVEICSLNLNV